MYACCFRHFKSFAIVSCHSEVRVLIYPLRDQTMNSFVSKNMFKWRGKRRGPLYSRISDFSYAIRRINSEDSFQLAVSDRFLEFTNIIIHIAYVQTIQKYEGFVDVKPTGDYILAVFYSHLPIFFNRSLAFMKIFFVVGNHYN